MHVRKGAEITLRLFFAILLAALPNYPSSSLTARYLLQPALAAPRQQDPDVKFWATKKLSNAAQESCGPHLCHRSAGKLLHQTERRY